MNDEKTSVFYVYLYKFWYGHAVFITRFKDRIYSSETMDYQVIPDDAIRLRILAHSDEEADQEVKRAVRDAVNKTISEWVQDLTEIEAARNLIERNLSTVDEIVGQTLHQHGMADDYQVTYGENIAFPAKLY